MTERNVVIVDGNAIMHRAYHALPPLSVNGKVVNAVYGFFAMLLNVLQETKPTHLVVCFDRSKPTIRQSMYAGYHAHRPQMASDLSPQFQMVEDILHRTGVPIVAVEGYEGDDCVGTVARRVSEQAVHTENGEKPANIVVVTGDRDLLQLVDHQTRVLMLVTGVTKTALFDEAKVTEKYGVKPEQFIDYKALIGDASDGYPGVSGIGPKTAAQLLQQYNTFENLYEHVTELPEKIGLKLATDAEQAALAKKLATIVRDVPVQVDLEKASLEQFDFSALREEFIDYDFKSLLNRLIKQYPRAAEMRKKEKLSDGQMELL